MFQSFYLKFQVRIKNLRTEKSGATVGRWTVLNKSYFLHSWNIFPSGKLALIGYFEVA